MSYWGYYVLPYEITSDILKKVRNLGHGVYRNRVYPV